MRRSSSSSSSRKRPSKFPKDSFPQTIGNFEVTVIDDIYSRFLYTENFGIECWGPDSVEKIVTDILGIYDSREHPLIDKVKFYTSASGPVKGQRYFVQRKPEDAVLFVFRMLPHKYNRIKLFVSANKDLGSVYGYPYDKHRICYCKMTMKMNPLCEGCRGLDPKLSTVKCASMDYRDITCTRFTQIKDSYILGEHPPRLRRFACEGCRDFSDDEEMEEEEREPYERLTTRKYWCGGCKEFVCLERSDFKPSKWEHDEYIHKCRECGDDVIEINEEDLPV